MHGIFVIKQPIEEVKFFFLFENHFYQSKDYVTQVCTTVFHTQDCSDEFSG